MRSDIHPKYNQVLAKCVCGHEFNFNSTLDVAYMNIEVCNECHPFYTGTQKVASTTGRAESFNRKFQNRQQPAVESKPAASKSVTKKS